ncbi:hypothetical protein M404DRAFT_698268 [Pisolithus tinctorius Marx 270]|uniref:Uncharacterized protein n=1 Tax=Pisolithus tinctorius Marx 270 TaxID=870435 RepID=A0A0C3PVJ0_PISTI|nr:hypothetical protein M404DRAFT_698268 [Pisolithus tinctorius Marx 270]
MRCHSSRTLSKSNDTGSQKEGLRGVSRHDDDHTFSVGLGGVGCLFWTILTGPMCCAASTFAPSDQLTLSPSFKPWITHQPRYSILTNRTSGRLLKVYGPNSTGTPRMNAENRGKLP